VTEGALVGQGEATQLAVIQQIDPMYVNFTQPAAEVLKLRRALEGGQLKRAGEGAAIVRVVLEDGTEHTRPGKLLFSDLTVDATSGQITLRAEVPNPGGAPAAWPVRARAAGAGPGQQCHHAAAAGRDALGAGRQRHGGGGRRQGQPRARSRWAASKTAAGWCWTV
jgi:hypothetical protein